MAPETNYQRAARRIREITDTLRPGDQLPKSEELADLLGAATGTVSRAVNELAAAGLLEIRRGVGIFVRRYDRITRSSPDRLRRAYWSGGTSIQQAETEGRETEEFVTAEAAPLPAWAADRLGLTAGEMAAKRYRRYQIDRRIVMLATSWLSWQLASRDPRIMEESTGPGGLYNRLLELGEAPARFVEDVTARPPTVDEAETMRLTPGTSVFEVIREAITERDRVIEVNRIIMAGDVYRLRYKFDA